MKYFKCPFKFLNESQILQVWLIELFIELSISSAYRVVLRVASLLNEVMEGWFTFLGVQKLFLMWNYISHLLYFILLHLLRDWQCCQRCRRHPCRRFRPPVPGKHPRPGDLPGQVPLGTFGLGRRHFRWCLFKGAVCLGILALSGEKSPWKSAWGAVIFVKTIHRLWQPKKRIQKHKKGKKSW